MSVNLESLKRILKLVEAANSATGKSDTNLTEAFKSLIKLGDVKAIATGSFTLLQQTYCSPAIEHGLGRAPLFAICVRTDLDSLTPETVRGKVTCLMYSPLARNISEFGLSVAPSYNINTQAKNLFSVYGTGTPSTENAAGSVYTNDEIVIFKSPIPGNDVLGAATYDWWVC